jgi:hypothetical protein
MRFVHNPNLGIIQQEFHESGAHPDVKTHDRLSINNSQEDII